MSSKKPSIQPRATKASLLRQQKQPSATGLVSASASTEPSPKKTNDSRTSQINNNVGASQGVKAFMAQQRARIQSTKKEKEEPVKKKKTFMTGAERYGSGGFEEKSVVGEPRKLQIVIKQAKASGKLDISSRGLDKLPEEVLKMYQVDPNSIVVDFTSTGDAWYDAVELTKFIASDNALTEIDSRLGEEFGALTHIDFRDNRLSSLPDTLQNLQNLTSIMLPYNQFEQIPPVLFQLQQLKELNLSHNQLKDVSLEQTSIERLDLSDNQIRNIHVDQNHSYRFTKLNLSYNQIEKLPLLLGWTKLQELNVNQNRLKYIFAASKEKVELPLLERLDAGNNLLTTISQDTHVSLPKLIELSLMTNKLEEDALVGLSSAPQLKTLDISSNQLKNVPSHVSNLQDLERLDVRGNQLHALSYELGKLEHLKVLNCEGNPMRAVTSMSHTQLIASLKSNYQQMLEEGGGTEEPQLQTLEPTKSLDHIEDLESNKEDEITELSNQLAQKVNITKKLDLSNQQLSEFPQESINFNEDIPGTILLDHNVFTIFPSYLSTISQFIVHLNLEHNRLTSFSFTLEGVIFTHLKTLKLSNNRLKSIECKPNTPSSFPKLEDLSMNYNTIAQLPDNFAQILPHLRVLSLSSNKLDQITEHQFSKTLETLDLSNNDIGFLPPGLSTLENLKSLIVFGNRFRIPRPAVVEQGTQAILEFLKRRYNN